MARLLSICLVLIILSALLMECESRLMLKGPSLYCCYRSRCVRSKRTPHCCGKNMHCKTRGRKRIGVCRRRPKCPKGRDAQEAEENIDVPDTRELEEDNAPIDFLDTLMNP
ncbi:hypothetical protein ACOMHN_023354 [Nucella lapillus]